VYSNADEIDFDVLPNQFVAKANFGSCAREIIIVPDKSKLDIAGARKTISGWKKPWWRSAWGGYEFVQPKILIEKYVEQLAGQVYDYKLWCFNGDPVLYLFAAIGSCITRSTSSIWIGRKPFALIIRILEEQAPSSSPDD
jgi:hypothetical protein